MLCTVEGKALPTKQLKNTERKITLKEIFTLLDYLLTCFRAAIFTTVTGVPTLREDSLSSKSIWTMKKRFLHSTKSPTLGDWLDCVSRYFDNIYAIACTVKAIAKKLQ